MFFQPTVAEPGQRAAVTQAPGVEATGALEPRNADAQGRGTPARWCPRFADWRTLDTPPGTGPAGLVVNRTVLGWIPREFGLEEGDAILQVNGEAVTSAGQLLDAVEGSSEGSAVEFQVRLAGTTERVAYSVSR